MGLKAVSANVAASLGYTPVNKAGDTMTGSLLFTGSAKNVNLSSDGALTWSSNVAGTNANDTFLYRDAANTIAQRNSTNAQTYNIYNTYTDASNYERAFLLWSGNDFYLGTEKAGTGVNRNLKIFAGGVGIYLATAGIDRILLSADYFTPLSNGVLDLGQAAAAWKRLYVDYTNTATVGDVTINKAAGRVNIDALGTSVVVTNSLVTAASKVFAVVSTADATAVLKNVVPTSGSFTITLSAATTAPTTIDFFVVNAD